MARILYFAQLVERLGLPSETVTLPATVTDVRSLLAWLRGRGGAWEQLLADDAVRITVNRQFVNLDTPVGGDAEIGIVSTRHG
jgi:molybdopterin synthase sulfur carrier subunit